MSVGDGVFTRLYKTRSSRCGALLGDRGTPHPTFYVAPRTIDPKFCESLHAKCVVADGRVSIVGSANFTNRGQSRNIEVGGRIEDAGFAQAVVGQFRAATNAGVFQRVG